MSYHSSKPELSGQRLLLCSEEPFNWHGDFPEKPSDKQEQKAARREQVIGLVKGQVYGEKQDFSIKVSPLVLSKLSHRKMNKIRVEAKLYLLKRSYRD